MPQVTIENESFTIENQELCDLLQAASTTTEIIEIHLEIFLGDGSMIKFSAQTKEDQ